MNPTNKINNLGWLTGYSLLRRLAIPNLSKIELIATQQAGVTATIPATNSTEFKIKKSWHKHHTDW